MDRNVGTLRLLYKLSLRADSQISEKFDLKEKLSDKAVAVRDRSVMAKTLK